MKALIAALLLLVSFSASAGDDIFSGDVRASGDWDVCDQYAFHSLTHCQTPAYFISEGGRMWFHTPIGWVG